MPNAVEVSNHVKATLDTLVKEYKSKGFNYSIAIIDQSIYTMESAQSVIHDLF